MNYLITLAYDGTNYCGYQVQPNGRSIAQTFQDALQAVVGTRPDTKGCSRTDAGVHARGFALNFHLENGLNFPLQKLPLALNAHLPADIRVLSACAVPEDFHARYAAHTKTYHYRIRNGAADSPFDARFTTKINRPLGLAKMQAAAKDFIGTYDCISLCAAGSSAAAHGDTVRTITDCSVLQDATDPEILTISITANGYLYNMVRIVAGTLVEIGQGKRAADSVPAILASKNRQNAGQTLAAKGLSLWAVHYPQDVLIPSAETAQAE